MRSPFFHILLTAFLVGFFALSLYDVKHVEGSSMYPTLRNRETVIVYRWAYGLQLPFIQRYLIRWSRVKPGDLVFFQDPVYEEPVVKRCVAGERTLIIRNGEGMVIGEEQLTWSEVKTDQFCTLSSVPLGKIFLLGDNRTISFDSRYYGFVEEKDIEGRVIRFWKW